MSQKYATLLVRSADRDKMEERIEELKKNSKNITGYTIRGSDPVLDKVIEKVSGTSNAISTAGTHVFRLEVKVSEKEELYSLAQKLIDMVRSDGKVTYTEPYEYVEPK
jgi:hypothetical protein